MSIYSTREVIQLTGATLRQVQHWDELYLHVPLMKHRRQFSDVDLRKIRLLGAWRRRGLLDGRGPLTTARIRSLLSRFCEAQHMLWRGGMISQFAEASELVRAAVAFRGPVILLHARNGEEPPW